MNWIRKVFRPKIRALVSRKSKDVPENMWEKCPSCGQMSFQKELNENLRTCPHCDHHLRMTADARLASLFDDKRYDPVPLSQVKRDDPLHFKDREKYTERLKRSRSNTGMQDAALVGDGRIGGVPAVVFALDFRFLGGSMGVAVGEALLTAAKRAVESRAALILVTASGGARMQEGILSLMQMPRSILALEQVKEAGLPVINILADPTTGGVTASFGMLADIHISEPGAMIGFAGQRVIEETIRESLPDNFQRAEYLLDHGMIDLVVHRHKLADTVAKVLRLLQPA